MMDHRGDALNIQGQQIMKQKPKADKMSVPRWRIILGQGLQFISLFCLGLANAVLPFSLTGRFPEYFGVRGGCRNCSVQGAHSSFSRPPRSGAGKVGDETWHVGTSLSAHADRGLDFARCADGAGGVCLI